MSQWSQTSIVPGLPDAEEWVRAWVDMHTTMIRAELLPPVTLGLGILGLLASGFLTVRTASSSAPAEAALFQRAAVGAAVALVVIALGVVLFLRRARRIAAVAATLPPAVEWLQRRPQDIVWVYPEQTQWIGRYGSRGVEYGLGLGLVTGQRAVVSVRTEGDRARVLATLQRMLPRATVGFSPEIEQAFQRDPASLQKNPWR